MTVNIPHFQPVLLQTLDRIQDAAFLVAGENRGYSQVDPRGSVKKNPFPLLPGPWHLLEASPSLFLYVRDTLLSATGKNIATQGAFAGGGSWEPRLAVAGTALRCCGCSPCPACFLLRLAWCLWAWMGCTFILSAVAEIGGELPCELSRRVGMQVSPNMPHRVQVQLLPAVFGCGRGVVSA